MNKVIALKNVYIDSSNISYNNKSLKDIIDELKKPKIAWCSEFNQVRYPGGLDNRNYYPISNINTLNANISVSDNKIKIGKGISKIKLSYNIRIDWDAPVGVVYYSMVTTTNGDIWSTHNAINKTNMIQYIMNFSDLIIDVKEGYEVAISVWNSGNSDITHSENLNLYIEVIQ